MISERFEDREAAARELAELLLPFRGKKPLVLAIPRGAVPMGKIIADRLGGELDLLLVKKIGRPSNPEFALGAVTEDGEILLNDGVSVEGAFGQYVEDEAVRIIGNLREKRYVYSGRRTGIAPDGRDVIVVDDGIATGATMAAAVRALKRRHPRSVTIASPVASVQAVRLLEAEGVQVRALRTPDPFGAVGYYYEDFSQLSDAEVGAHFRISAIEIPTGDHTIPLQALVGYPEHSIGTVIFAHGSGSGRLSPRNQYVADFLNRRGMTTVLVDLLTEPETRDRANVFDLKLLSERVLAVTRWAERELAASGTPIGYFGASTGAGAALRAAARRSSSISAVVSRGGRPDLAGAALAKVKAPTLLIVGGADPEVLALNRQSLAKLKAQKRIEIVPQATHLFEEEGTLERVAELAAEWFESHFLAESPDVQATLRPGP